MSETLFKEVRYDLDALMKFIELGEIGLPDIQRPFVWKNSRIRDLFDSMYQGYPVGYLLFWQNALMEDSKVIGTDQKQKIPRLLIVDGQQRLTSLYAVLKGISVIRENYQAELIEIAFNPIHEKFEVADAAIQKDKSFIPNISIMWNKETDLFEIVDNYFENLKANRDIEDNEKKKIREAIKRVHNLVSFPFTVLELSGSLNEEQVSEVFVRINSKGKSLNQADFILTLMSVFWDEGRSQLEDFCRKARIPSLNEVSPFNYFIQPDPGQLLRVSVGLGFKRARLKFVYSILRGKDLETETFSDERRVEQFEVLKKAQEQVLNLQYWHDFLKMPLQAGYRNEKMISSKNNLLFSYILYILGRVEFKVDEFKLRRILARWFFMSSLTGRYTGSPESTMEFDLARFRDVKGAEEFILVLERICEEKMTNDFWSITLPSDLATSSAMSPSLFGYIAALNLIDSKVLFSKQKVSELLDPSTKSFKSAIERHHLFPKGYLKTLGISNLRETNQIANYALVEWGDNLKISDQSPSKYLPNLKKRFGEKELERMYYWHALPKNWENLEYKDFLIQRRELISKVIKDGYKTLCEDGVEEGETRSSWTVKELISDGETTEVEFKSTLRVNLHTGQNDPRMEHSCLKTIAGFLNQNGGTLIIGVTDDGDPIGIESDGFKNEDKMHLHLINLIKDRIGSQYMLNIHPRFEDYKEVRILAVECWRGGRPVFLKDGNLERFYIRMGASTSELTGNQMQSYIEQRFK